MKFEVEIYKKPEFLDCRGASFGVSDELLYIENGIRHLIRPEQLVYDSITWTLYANEIIIHGRINKKHPNLYCLKNVDDDDRTGQNHVKIGGDVDTTYKQHCMIGYEASKPMTGQPITKVGR